MARFAVFASGSGSNFQAIAEAAMGGPHELTLLAYDRKAAFAKNRADILGIKSYYLGYKDRERSEVEAEAIEILEVHHIDFVVLAGFMRLFTPHMIDRYASRMINIHPALLPSYPGTHSIERAFDSGEARFGITIHFVDQGTDTGPHILQRSFLKKRDEDFASIEKRVHELEHVWYPRVTLGLLDELDRGLL